VAERAALAVVVPAAAIAAPVVLPLLRPLPIRLPLLGASLLALVEVPLLR